MDERPGKHPWEAELEAEVLAEERARRGNQSTTISSPTAPPAPAVEGCETAPAAPVAAGPDTQPEGKTEEELAREFEIEFMQQNAAGGPGKNWLAAWLATDEGRIVLIASIACVILVLLGRFLSSSISSQLPQP